MANQYLVTRLMTLKTGLLALLLVMATSTGYAQQVDKVTIVEDANGWKMQVNGEDFYVKGVVWGYSPIGENYSYNLWGKPDAFIKEVLAQEMGMLREMNVNAIRTFSLVPPKWVTYIYQQYGIMSVINPLFGRYGANINGVWVPNTNYQDPTTREILTAEFVEVVKEYKDVPGVLMFALGNESNYGLSWSSFEIENLPAGEQNRGKAVYLYSLFNEAIQAGREVAPDHLYTIVNGGQQYLDLIAEYGADWDMLGINAYQGVTFENRPPEVQELYGVGESLWEDVRVQYGKPVVFFEFGADAFNAKEFREDQKNQALYLKAQWQEMYNKAYGQGEQGNSIGGFIFEWRDEWWKYKQTENLDIQDTTASWVNGAYKFDHVEGQNNMNEEWFGITRLGEVNPQGIHPSEPRMAYYMMKDIFNIDVYETSKAEVNRSFRNLDLDTHEVRGEIELLKSKERRSESFKLSGGSITGEYFVKAFEEETTENGENGLRWTDGQRVDLDFEFQPSNRLRGEFTLNLLANVAESDFEFRYGDRGLPITVLTIDEDTVVTGPGTPEDLNDRERIELYDFNATYEGDTYTLETFYHVPRYHWPDKGDFFGLLRETTDMDGQDIWNSKAPYGFEYTGKDNGLTILAGPEVYWGANPKAMIKYDFDVGGVPFTLIHSEDVATREDSSSSTEAVTEQSRQTTLYTKLGLGEKMTLELGGLISAGEKIGEEYDRLVGDDEIRVDEIEAEDTLGVKAKLSFDVLSSKAYVGLNYAGLVADAGDETRQNGTELPYSNLGNKKELEAGVLIPVGDFTIYPRIMVRENIVDANPFIDASTTGTTLTSGISPRNLDDDPFAVLGNREVNAGEVVITYDPTPATYFYYWNADITEDAPFAANLGLTYMDYETATDSDRFFFEEGNVNVPFGEGLAPENTYLVKSKLIFNPSIDRKYIFNLQRGKQQSTGRPGQETVEFKSFEAKAVINREHIFSGYYKDDAFGPYDFYRQFNLTYPTQVMLEYARLLDLKLDEETSSRYGIKLFYRTLDEGSPEFETEEGEDSDHMFEIQTYFTYNF